jgi:hypothetical protein
MLAGGSLPSLPRLRPPELSTRSASVSAGLLDRRESPPCAKRTNILYYLRPHRPLSTIADMSLNLVADHPSSTREHLRTPPLIPADPTSLSPAHAAPGSSTALSRVETRPARKRMEMYVRRTNRPNRPPPSFAYCEGNEKMARGAKIGQIGHCSPSGVPTWALLRGGRERQRAELGATLVARCSPKEAVPDRLHGRFSHRMPINCWR